MLTSDQFDALVTPITELYTEYETTVLMDIARRLKNMDFSSAAWQTQRITESGSLYKNVLKELSRLTGKSETQIAEILKRAGVKAINFDDKIYKEAGLEPLPLNLSPAMLDVLKANLEKTSGVITNLTGTTALTAQRSFIHAADLAHLQVSSGAMSYDDAIRRAIKNVAAQGLDVINYASGHTDKLDVATRRAVLTGIAQTTNQLQETRADEMGTDLVQVSAHGGARNKGIGPANHASWQGKIFSRSGTHKKYPNFAEVTGYGTGEGLGGWNCRHSFFPFFEDISENAYSKEDLKELKKEKVKYQGEEVDLYQATQVQREYERKIREWKRKAETLSAAKLDNSFEVAKVKQWQASMRDFINQTGLDRQSSREAGFGTPKIKLNVSSQTQTQINANLVAQNKEAILRHIKEKKIPEKKVVFKDADIEDKYGTILGQYDFNSGKINMYPAGLNRPDAMETMVHEEAHMLADKPVNYDRFKDSVFTKAWKKTTDFDDKPKYADIKAKGIVSEYASDMLKAYGKKDPDFVLNEIWAELSRLDHINQLNTVSPFWQNYYKEMKKVVKR